MQLMRDIASELNPTMEKEAISRSGIRSDRDLGPILHSSSDKLAQSQDNVEYGLTQCSE